MLFNSWQFAIFLPVVFALHWTIPNKYRWVMLLVASYYFYMSWNVKYVTLILFTTIISYMAGILLERFRDKPSVKKFILLVTLISCLGVLFVFKYFNFFTQALSEVLNAFAIRLHPVTLKLLLPVGISFYTFQTLSYVIDVYRGSVKPERHFGIYALFVSFFPQLVAGPIERTNNLLPQLKAPREFDYTQATYGLKLIAWGLFKKLAIADVLAQYVDKVFSNVHDFRGFALVLATFFFTVQIYCDFSGYSDIARGSAKLMGIELMQNFRSPYFSSSIREFWSRWHISLSTWFRDYVYIPLGGNRVRKFRHCINLLVTFIISGLWHGANWTFVIWGGIHGVAQVIENIFTTRDNNPVGIRRAFKTLATFVFCMIAWVFFRAQDLSEAMYVFSNMFDGILEPRNFLHPGVGIGMKRMIVILGLIFIVAMYDFLSVKFDVLQKISQLNIFCRWIVYNIITTGIFFICVRFSVSNISFVYFQF